MFNIGLKGLGLGGAVLPDLDTTIESALYKILMEDSSVYDAVEGRIYPNIVPQNASMPAITYQQLTGPRLASCDGPDGAAHCNFQVNCWSEDYGNTRQISDLVRICLDGYSGTVNSRLIHVISLQNEGDMPQIEPEAEELSRFGKYLEFIVWFEEPLV
jgi:hypothetical protein